jgi:NAD(P)-dependent dehydrogenase (short-subunit alcohol dehydrogenase family)
MNDERVLVVGASSGVGRAIATRFVREGARVAFSARRPDALTEAVTEAGGGVVVAGDVRAPDGARDVVSGAVDALGGLDLVVYATGISPLARLGTFTPQQWTDVLQTNLVGLHQVVAAALAHLAPGATVAALSSDSVGHPRPGLVPYAASKAALEEMMRGWRVENPAVRFTTVVIGPTFPTGFSDNFEPTLFAELWSEWERLGVAGTTIMDGDQLAGLLVGLLRGLVACPGITLEEIVLRPTASS